MFAHAEAGTAIPVVHGVVEVPASLDTQPDVLDPDSTFDIDGFVGDFGEPLEQSGLSTWTVLDRHACAGANWKPAFDVHLDQYHLPVLHRNTFGVDLSPHDRYHHAGPHQRLVHLGR